jgi:aspartyl protease family protein
MTGLLTKTAAMVAALAVVALVSTGDLAQRMVDSPRAVTSEETGGKLTPVRYGSPDAANSVSGHGPVALVANGNGHFSAEPAINGMRVAMMVDTGASLVVLSEEDASRAGIRPMPADYTAKMSTANGVTLGAPVLLREVRLGDIVVHDVKAVVLQRGRLSGSLLGMSFLSRLSGFEIAKDRLVLRP